MDDYSKYTTDELRAMEDNAFSEYYRLATRPTSGSNPVNTALLEQAIDKFEAIRGEIIKRLANG